MGPRLGGRAPQGVAPASEQFAYFFTFPISGSLGKEFSLFLHRDLNRVIDEAGRLASDQVVEVIFHSSTARSDSPGPFDSALTEHPLEIGEPQRDETEEEGEAVPYSGHKTGGVPYLVENEPEFSDRVSELLKQGFVHAIQLDFPGNESDADVDGPWPVDTGMIHVLLRVGDGPSEWRCFWEL